MNTIHDLAWGSGRDLLSPDQVAVLDQYVANGGSYPHGFAQPGISAYDYASRLNQYAPKGWRLVALHWGYGKDELPAGSFRVGQYKVRSGDPESPIYLVPEI